MCLVLIIGLEINLPLWNISVDPIHNEISPGSWLTVIRLWSFILQLSSVQTHELWYRIALSQIPTCYTSLPPLPFLPPYTQLEGNKQKHSFFR